MKNPNITSIVELLDVMEKLRNPVTGCLWDRQQTMETLLPFMVEECYEVVDVVERKAWAELPVELGDLLFQIVFYCQLAKEQQQFDFATVASMIKEKLIRRHPHVFNVKGPCSLSSQELSDAWEQQKSQERKSQAHDSQMDNIPLSFPAVTRALKIQQRAARVGFDWDTLPPVVDKVREELDEVMAEVASLALCEPQTPDQSDSQIDGQSVADGENGKGKSGIKDERDTDERSTAKSRIEDEVGDLFFSVVNLARHLNVDPESALRQANGKFERRFRGVEARANASGRTMEEHSLGELEEYWQGEKGQEASK